MLICTGDRDAFQLVTDARDGALPAQGRLRDDALHAGGGRGEVRPHARRSTPTSRRCAATRATTCPASRAWGRRPRPSGSASSATSTTLVARVDEVKGKAGDNLRAHLAAVMQNRQLTELVRDVPLEVGPGDLAGPAGTATRCTRSSTPWSSGCCATGCTRRSTGAEPEAEEGFDVAERRVLAPGELGAWLAEHARAGARIGLHSAAPGGAAPATWPASRWRRPTDRGLVRRPGPTSTRPTSRRSPPGWPTRRSPRRARRQGPAARALRRAAGSCAGVPATPRWRRTSRMPGQRVLRPRRPRAALPAPRAAAPPSRRPADLRRARTSEATRRRGRRTPTCSRPRGPRPRRRARDRARASRRRPRCCARSSCR